MSSKRFRIAFSFAGEKRAFVAEVAGILAKHFGTDGKDGKASILYDKYHQAEFSRSDLAFHLGDLYERESDLVVAVFCPDYENKEWCGLEWNAIYGLIKARNVDEVMLTRFERVEGKGLRGIAGYVDLDDLTPEQTADLILKRLALNEANSSDGNAKPAFASQPVLKTTTPPNIICLGDDYLFVELDRHEVFKETENYDCALGAVTGKFTNLVDPPRRVGSIENVAAYIVYTDFDEPSREWHRVHYACWLNEESSRVSFGVGKTRHLIIGAFSPQSALSSSCKSEFLTYDNPSSDTQLSRLGFVNHRRFRIKVVLVAGEKAEFSQAHDFELSIEEKGGFIFEYQTVS